MERIYTLRPPGRSEIEGKTGTQIIEIFKQRIARIEEGLSGIRENGGFIFPDLGIIAVGKVDLSFTQPIGLNASTWEKRMQNRRQASTPFTRDLQALFAQIPNRTVYYIPAVFVQNSKILDIPKDEISKDTTLEVINGERTFAIGSLVKELLVRTRQGLSIPRTTEQLNRNQKYNDPQLALIIDAYGDDEIGRTVGVLIKKAWNLPEEHTIRAAKEGKITFAEIMTSYRKANWPDMEITDPNQVFIILFHECEGSGGKISEKTGLLRATVDSKIADLRAKGLLPPTVRSTRRRPKGENL